MAYGSCVALAARHRDITALSGIGLAVSVPMMGLLIAYDVSWHLLPRVITYGTLSATVPLLTISPGSPESHHSAAIVGALLMFGISGTIWVLGRGSLGRGDLHFSLLLGSIAGWFDLRLTGFTWLVAAVLSAFVAGVLLLRGHHRRSRFAFGPILLVGLCISLLQVN